MNLLPVIVGGVGVTVMHPGRGAFFIARVSEGRSPDDPREIIALNPSTPPGVGRNSDRERERHPSGVASISESSLTRGLRHFVPRHPGYEQRTPIGVPGWLALRKSTPY